MKRHDDPLFELAFDGDENPSRPLSAAEQEELRSLANLKHDLRSLAASTPEPSDLSIAKDRLRESLLDQGLRHRNPWFLRFAGLSAVSGCAAMLVALVMMSQANAPVPVSTVVTNATTMFPEINRTEPNPTTLAEPTTVAESSPVGATGTAPTTRRSTPPKQAEPPVSPVTKSSGTDALVAEATTLVSDPDPGIVVIGVSPDILGAMQVAVEVRQEANELIGG